MTERDPDTGRIKANGVFGTIIEWLRFLMPVIVIPVLLWALSVELRFERIQSFVSAGERFTRKDWEREQSNLELRILKELQSGPLERLYQLPPKFPPQDYRDMMNNRLQVLEARLVTLEQNDAAIRADLAVIRRILETE